MRANDFESWSPLAVSLENIFCVPEALPYFASFRIAQRKKVRKTWALFHMSGSDILINIARSFSNYILFYYHLQFFTWCQCSQVAPLGEACSGQESGLGNGRDGILPHHAHAFRDIPSLGTHRSARCLRSCPESSTYWKYKTIFKQKKY